MKALKNLILGVGLVGGMLLASCSGEYYVAETPTEPVYDQGVAPYADAYWVPGEWNWDGSRYVYVRGYWTHARTGHTYVSGHWRNTNRGHVWVRGRWR